MPASHSFRVKVAGLLGLVALLTALTLTFAACGGSSSASFEGTWVKKGQDGAMEIKKADSGYDVTIKSKASDTSGFTLKATEKDDTLTITDPTGKSKESITMTVDGDTLTMKSGTQTETLTRQ